MHSHNTHLLYISCCTYSSTSVYLYSFLILPKKVGFRIPFFRFPFILYNQLTPHTVNDQHPKLNLSFPEKIKHSARNLHANEGGGGQASESDRDWLKIYNWICLSLFFSASHTNKQSTFLHAFHCKHYQTKCVFIHHTKIYSSRRE